MGDWFDQSTQGGPSHYETQKRGYYSGGSFTGRLRMSNDYLISATPPRVRVGCGGIDLFGGAFSYLDGEYLVEKMERIIQAAPAFAFELAMSEFCKECKSTMDGLTNIMDQLNSMQINDCRMSKRLVHAVADEKPILEEMWAEASGRQSIGTGQRKNVQDYAEAARDSRGAPPDDTRDLVQDCPAVFRQVFTNGSVIGNVTDLLNLDSYAPLMRGMIGDAIVSYNEPANVFQVEVLSHCAGNDQLKADDFLTGTMEVKGTDDQCSTAGSRAITAIVEDNLTSIAQKIQDGSANFTVEEQAFIANSRNIPVLNLLRDAVGNGTVAETISMFREPLALVYAHVILDDLYKAIRLALSEALEINRDSSVGAGGDVRRCDPIFIAPAIEEVEKMRDRTEKYRSLAAANFRAKQEEMVLALKVAEHLRDNRYREMRRLGGSSE